MTGMSWQQDENGMRLVLPEELDLSMAPDLAARLREGLLKDGALRLDGAGVASISTACIQLLLAATREAATRKDRLVIVSPSPAFEDAAADLGLRDWLNDWSAE